MNNKNVTLGLFALAAINCCCFLSNKKDCRAPTIIGCRVSSFVQTIDGRNVRVEFSVDDTGMIPLNDSYIDTFGVIKTYVHSTRSGRAFIQKKARLNCIMPDEAGGEKIEIDTFTVPPAKMLTYELILATSTREMGKISIIWKPDSSGLIVRKVPVYTKTKSGTDTLFILKNIKSTYS
jgi:hypothetical protein